MPFKRIQNNVATAGFYRLSKTHSKRYEDKGENIKKSSNLVVKADTRRENMNKNGGMQNSKKSFFLPLEILNEVSHAARLNKKQNGQGVNVSSSNTCTTFGSVHKNAMNKE